MTGEHEPVPAWANEPVHLAEPDPGWPVVAEQYIDELHGLLGDRLAGQIEHMGSTAVPGLPVKPIIDLQAVSVDPAQAVADCKDALAAARWHVVPRELDQRPWRWFVVRTDTSESHRLAHLHLMTVDQPRRCQQLVFRDRLRASEDLVREYARLKTGAAAQHREDREAYTLAKHDFVQRVVADLQAPD
ncbi:MULTISPECIES: GrpB family protein [unclassified Pseudonocardia]|uniref:GrpB family protein n=1 Tax=unclassified Pseudonocardia TaxID=2619320 RepID=UPI00094B23B9|nr:MULTISPECIES: GrpB family protein [unclassified Pseudonocardia]